MALVPFTGVISIATLRANFDDKTATLAANAKLGKKSYEYFVGPISTLTNATLLRDRSVAFTPADDAQVMEIAAHGTADAASRTISFALTQADGGTTWLSDRSVTGSKTSVGATPTDVRKDYTSFTAVGDLAPLRVLRGVRYRLAVSSDTVAGSFSSAVVAILLQSVRRRS